jgi:iron(III) transport system permease protein
MIYLLFIVILPLAAVVARSLSPLYGSGYQITLSFYETVASSRPLRVAVVNTILVAAIAATLALPIYLGYALTILRSRSRALSSMVDIASTLPRAMPGLVVGLAFLWLYLFTPLRPLLYSLLGLAIAYIILWSILGIRILLTNLIQISSELEEVARIHGATQNTVLARITIPLLKRALLVTWLIIFIYGIREYSVPVFLSTGTPVIGSTIVLLIGSGELGIIAALATISVAITLATTVVIFKLGWKPYGALG